MDERSKRAQMERKRRIRRKKQRRRVLISALVEVLILAVLAFAFCWNRGLGTKISGFFGRFDRPPVKELDVTGVNSSNVVLMDVKSGAAFLKKRLEAGENLEDTAVLFRTNQEAEGLVGALMEYQIPFTMKEQLPNLFRHWISRNLMAYLKMAAGDRTRKLFLEIMNRPNRYIARDALTQTTISFSALRDFYKDKDWMCDRITTLETHLRILSTLAPYAAVNFIRKGMGYEQYLIEYAQ